MTYSLKKRLVMGISLFTSLLLFNPNIKNEGLFVLGFMIVTINVILLLFTE